MRLLVWLAIVLGLIGATGAGFFVFMINQDLVPIDLYHRFEDTKAGLVLDDQDQILFKFELDKRTYITINNIPEVLTRAFVAAEDHDFFNHMGLSFRGIVRSAFVNVYNGRVVQGASTITQQVARLLFLTHQRTWWRKLQEVLLALQLENIYTKHQIFELYLNNMYFGRGIYGVEAACQRFWAKSVNDVTLEEAAVLAAVAKSARFYSPLNAPQSAKKRRNVVLASMKNLGFISAEVCAAAQAKPLHVVEVRQGNPLRLYVQEWVRTWMEQRWGKDATYSQGMIIKTTLNQQAQRAAEEAFVGVVGPMSRKLGPSLNGGLITLDASSGAIKAFVGGLNFYQSQFNRAFQANRQIGSSFKPIFYALALTSGFELEDIFYDEQVTFVMPNGSKWTPKNWNDKFEGAMTLARALTYSNNLISIKLLLKLGAERVANMARLFGFSQPIVPYPSLALGTVEGTVVENAAAFNVFANHGVYVKPFFIESVKDRSGKKIWQHEPMHKKLIDQVVCSKMVRALQLRMELAKRQSQEGWFDAQSIGKTGSTNGAATTWFVGSTPEFTTAVYVGRDDGKPMGTHVFASKTAYPIWLALHRELTYHKQRFYIDPRLEEVPVNWLTGELSYPDEIGRYDSHTIMLLKERNAS
jgi:penicillin-binding protein 1A